MEVKLKNSGYPSRLCMLNPFSILQMNGTLTSDESTNHDKEEESEIDMAIKLETSLIEGDESELVVIMR